MRINLVTPFAEKDAVKALGARWDPGKKLWYITDVPDLAPFMRWIPDMDVAVRPTSSAVEPGAKPTTNQPSKVLTKSAICVPHCGCSVLPWMDCEHSATR